MRDRSATVPAAGQSDADVLRQRAVVWSRRPLTREVYRRYFERMTRELAAGTRNIEIGGGSGMSREFLPGIHVSDIVGTPFVDFVADATRLPLRSLAADNLLMLDVLHHLPQPAAFFREAVRVLRPGGRIVMLEPYISFVSRIVFKLAHPEPVDMGADPLPADGRPVLGGHGPFASNQAIPTLLFGRHRKRLAALFPELRIVTCTPMSLLVYPLSGGFSGPCLLPRFVQPLAWGLERVLSPLRKWMAFRLLVTLERV